MPNWVFNTVHITGPESELIRFRDYINVMPEYATVDNAGFSFHSFVTLPPSTDREAYLGTRGSVEGQQVNTESINWYNWNISNWNTKWDACESSVSTITDPKGYAILSIHIEFQTAWAPPEPVFVAMSTMFPELNFHIWYEEEQGWGAEYDVHNQKMHNVTQWDIPDSHADYQEQRKDCVCVWDDDMDNWYDDCPGKSQTVYTIEVVTRMTVKAIDENTALLAAEAEQSGYDLPSNSSIISVAYANDYRVTSVEEVRSEPVTI